MFMSNFFKYFFCILSCVVAIIILYITYWYTELKDTIRDFEGNHSFYWTTFLISILGLSLAALMVYIGYRFWKSTRA